MSGLFDREGLTEVEVPVTPAPIPRRESPPPERAPAPPPDEAPQEAAEAEAIEQPVPEEAPPQHADGGFRVPEGCTVLEGVPEGEGRTVGVVVSRFNAEITTSMLEQALAELDRLGVARSSVTVMPVPGAFELPLAAMALAKTRRFSCVVALGCVIRGETSHFDFVAGEAASGIQLAAIETGVPVAFGVLTTETREQAEARIARAADAARGALEMAHLFGQLRARAAATA
jgi:6,7-dimethyl-8-ribityllumazine synthase